MLTKFKLIYRFKRFHTAASNMNVVAIVLCILFSSSFRGTKGSVFLPDGTGMIGEEVGYAFHIKIRFPYERAARFCNSFYPYGQLAWMGDMTNKAMQKIADHAGRFMKSNNYTYFWVDGVKSNAYCCPEKEYCAFKPQYFQGVLHSYVLEGTSLHFTASLKDFHMVSSDARDEDYAPAVLVNTANKLIPYIDEYVTAVVPVYLPLAFICSYQTGIRRTCQRRDGLHLYEKIRHVLSDS